MSSSRPSKSDALMERLLAEQAELSPALQASADRALARATARLQGGGPVAVVSPTDEQLFGAPLPAQEGEPGFPAPRSTGKVLPWRSGGLTVSVAAAAAFLLWFGLNRQAPLVPAVPQQSPSVTEASKVAAAPAPAQEANRQASALEELPQETPEVAAAKPQSKTAVTASVPTAKKSIPSGNSKGGLSEPWSEINQGPSQGMVPAAQSTSLPDHPASGALQAALAPSQAKAASCLPAGAPGASVQLTFNAKGEVVAVVPPSNVSPEAAACLRSAFQSARVAPFARPTYSVGVTARPRQ